MLRVLKIKFIKSCDIEIKDKIGLEKALYEIIKRLDKVDLIYGYKYYKVNYIFENIFTKDVKGEYHQIYKNLLSEKMGIIVILECFIYY